MASERQQGGEALPIQLRRLARTFLGGCPVSSREGVCFSSIPVWLYAQARKDVSSTDRRIPATQSFFLCPHGCDKSRSFSRCFCRFTLLSLRSTITQKGGYKCACEGLKGFRVNSSGTSQIAGALRPQCPRALSSRRLVSPPGNRSNSCIQSFDANRPWSIRSNGLRVDAHSCESVHPRRAKMRSLQLSVL